MRPNDYAVERTRLNRRVYHSALAEWVMGRIEKTEKIVR
ncbi:hypothetical protein ALQ30_200140 [Pseudomonas syringae pv. persicae]|uniref:Uncharacterized protein n=1 Tax=Pseudomonas syringae pv. persicae TaxID=237306 RepID=A0A3M4B1F5_9PSED|nr:hypothetical protein ALQ30_200140 [Pseudomonas syringae pv. persicae]